MSHTATIINVIKALVSLLECGNWHIKMKNIIIVVLTIAFATTLAVAHVKCNEVDKGCAIAQFETATRDVVINFALLAERWGDDARCDTLLSNSQWAKIKAHDVSVDEAIALARLVEEAYEENYYSYADAIDDADFQSAVKKYNWLKEYISENGYNK